jgi:glycosyltransferase involved in cell wall biosynthesis
VRVCHAVTDLAADSGGPSRSVPLLCGYLADQGVETTILVRDLGKRVSAEAAAFTERGVIVETADPGRCIAAATIVHLHGLWSPFTHAVAVATRRARIPLVISPRGMLEPWSLAHHRWRKRAAWLLYQRRDVAGAALLHATAPDEGENLRALGLRAPIAVVPNGVVVEPAGDEAPRERVFLFLSRLHPKKGAHLLLEAVARISGRMREAGWRCIIAGPDEGGHGADLRALADRLGVTDLVSFRGPVEGSEKRRLYRTASLFVLPSFSENFGIVVAEALAHGTPALSTTGTPWRDLGTYDCGWWTEPTMETISIAMREAMTMPPDELRRKGERGRALVAERYSWPAAAQAMASAYAWLDGGGKPPACLLP